MENLDKAIKNALNEQLRALLNPHEILAKIQKETPYALFGTDKDCDPEEYAVNLQQIEVIDYSIDKKSAPLFKIRRIQFQLYPIQVGILENGYMFEHSNNLLYGVNAAVIGMELQGIFNYQTEKHDFTVPSHDLAFGWFNVERV